MSTSVHSACRGVNLPYCGLILENSNFPEMSKIAARMVEIGYPPQALRLAARNSPFGAS
jgi:hypothetical protein